MSSRFLIIGGNSGIGKCLWQQLIAQGNHVSLALRKTDGIPTSTLVDVQLFDASAPQSLSLPESLDGVVYCPGTIHLKPFHRLTQEDFLKDLQVNCLAAVHVLQQAFPLLKKSAHASVVLFSTIAVDQGMPFHASIATAKGALEGLMKSLAAEWAPHIRVNAIAPTLTHTALSSSLLNTESKVELANKRHPSQQIGKAEDVAACAAFLLSPASKGMTGQILRPDGGLSSLRIF